MTTIVAHPTSAANATRKESLIRSALIHNNEGVALLERGKPKEAAAHFTHALNQMNQSMRIPTDVNRATDVSPSPSPSSPYTLFTIPHLSSTEDDCAQFLLFDGAMTLAAEGNQAEDIAFYIAAGMLNLAMGFHQMGEMSSSTQDKTGTRSIFQKADRLYQAVQQVVEAGIQQPNQPHTTTCMFRFLFVAAQNNRLGIALESGNYTIANQFKKEMDSMLKTMFRDQPQETVYLDEFMRNSSLLGITCMLTSLAAACA
ncbi:expressed unknown protein [Seminavis robusta]|uniref:Uncharacterized protein n=1 Tax=Seminavis robusta TaxID=568900 RepID=A0A9N8E4L6_9STRA|nr:expressed unknown protein [Seminavis robusta]|eukprot:Sro614_g175700.1 n/a (257) ;mRNA; f:22686-23456